MAYCSSSNSLEALFHWLVICCILLYCAVRNTVSVLFVVHCSDVMQYNAMQRNTLYRSVLLFSTVVVVQDCSERDCSQRPQSIPDAPPVLANRERLEERFR